MAQTTAAATTTLASSQQFSFDSAELVDPPTAAQSRMDMDLEQESESHTQSAYERVLAAAIRVIIDSLDVICKNMNTPFHEPPPRLSSFPTPSDDPEMVRLLGPVLAISSELAKISDFHHGSKMIYNEKLQGITRVATEMDSKMSSPLSALIKTVSKLERLTSVTPMSFPQREPYGRLAPQPSVTASASAVQEKFRDLISKRRNHPPPESSSSSNPPLVSFFGGKPF